MRQNAKDIAVLVGSLRRDSTSRKAALALSALAPESLRLDLVETGHLPFYDQDFDADAASTPDSYRASAIASAVRMASSSSRPNTIVAFRRI